MSSRFLDLDRLHRAKDILLQDLENSLSLLELAHQVGLNDYKLKAGFRQIFGTTVFGYLHQQRMCRTYELLTSGNLTSDKPVHEFPRQLDIATANVYGLAILSAGLFLFLSNCLIH